MSPGIKYKHYAPKTKCILVYSSNKDLLIKKMQELEENNRSRSSILRVAEKL